MRLLSPQELRAQLDEFEARHCAANSEDPADIYLLSEAMLCSREGDERPHRGRYPASANCRLNYLTQPYEMS